MHLPQRAVDAAEVAHLADPLAPATFGRLDHDGQADAGHRRARLVHSPHARLAINGRVHDGARWQRFGQVSPDGSDGSDGSDGPDGPDGPDADGDGGWGDRRGPGVGREFIVVAVVVRGATRHV